MKKNNEIEIQKILESMDGMDRAHPKPFLYGRIQNRLERESKSSFWREWRYQLVAGLLIVLLNATVVYSSFQQTDNLTDEVEYLVEEYGFHTSDYDLNEE